VEEVRRASDDELCGFIERRDGSWCSIAIFGVLIDRHESRDLAISHVLGVGLEVLTERWTLRQRDTGDEEVVCILEATPGSVTVALGYYSLPGVPTLTITADQIASGEWDLRP
jgi:hypothetical protein